MTQRCCISFLRTMLHGQSAGGGDGAPPLTIQQRSALASAQMRLGTHVGKILKKKIYVNSVGGGGAAGAGGGKGLAELHFRSSFRVFGARPVEMSNGFVMKGREMKVSLKNERERSEARRASSEARRGEPGAKRAWSEASLERSEPRAKRASSEASLERSEPRAKRASNEKLKKGRITGSTVTSTYRGCRRSYLNTAAISAKRIFLFEGVQGRSRSAEWHTTPM